MSALASITEYGSSSDENDENDFKAVKKFKLQVPNLDSLPVSRLDIHIDNPLNHDGRVRSFPHVRGNWASFVFIKYNIEEYIRNVIDKIQFLLNLHFKESFHICEDFHISLSKTFVLQYHLINSFTKSLKEIVSGIECFNLNFAAVNIYCNEDKTRTFISIKVDYWTKKFLVSITNKIDQVLKEYKLQPFYEDPSFHLSILWLNGSKRDELLPLLEQFNLCLTEESQNLPAIYPVEAISCKIGNKLYQFSLK